MQVASMRAWESDSRRAAGFTARLADGCAPEVPQQKHFDEDATCDPNGQACQGRQIGRDEESEGANRLAAEVGQKHAQHCCLRDLQAPRDGGRHRGQCSNETVMTRKKPLKINMLF
jgi:hypothetical protein